MRHFTFVSKGINSETHKEEWRLIEKIHHIIKPTEQKVYDKLYTSDEIVDFLKLFSLNTQIKLSFN